MTATPIYLDYNGTTPVYPAVLDAMLPYLREHFGNPSSTTPLGRLARNAVENARAQVASLINADPSEIIFTGGGTEASNHAIRGLAAIAPAARRVIVTSTVEHPATEMPCRRLEAAGFGVVRVPVCRDGRLDMHKAGAAIDATTAFVTLIHAQNETGVLQPVAEIARVAGNAGAPVHVDASQSLGKVPVDVRDWGIDALTIAGHKLYAPKGIGALFLRGGLAIPSVLDGAGQEQGRRPGTENVAYIVGLGEACVLAGRAMVDESARVEVLRDLLWKNLTQRVPGLIRVGAGATCLPNTLNILFPEAVGNDVLNAAPGIAASTGSACHAGDSRPSAIILAHGFAPEIALGAVRITLGRGTSEADINRAAAALADAWNRTKRR